MILGNMIYLLPYPRAPPPPSPRVLLPPSQEAPRLHLPPSPRAPMPPLPQALTPLLPLPRVPVLPLPRRSPGATIATGAIANTATISTGTFTTSAAIFMGVPALPPPRARQTSDHPLDSEQDISMAASAIASAAGATSLGTASAAVEYDSLSCRAQGGGRRNEGLGSITGDPNVASPPFVAGGTRTARDVDGRPFVSKPGRGGGGRPGRCGSNVVIVRQSDWRQRHRWCRTFEESGHWCNSNNSSGHICRHRRPRGLWEGGFGRRLKYR